jgi:hypothetical protein
MKIEVQKMVETLGVFAVVLSLIFVGLELRQSNDIAIRDARNEITERRSDIAELEIENSSLRKLLIKLSNANADLSEEESIEVDGLVRLYIGYWASIQAAHEGGFLPERVYEVYLKSAELTSKQYPYLAKAVRERLQELRVGADLGEIYAVILKETAQ